MPLIFDSTPLIYLGKLMILDKLKHLKRKLLIPQQVFTEVVVEGKKLGKEDAFLVEKLINEGLFKIKAAEKATLNYFLKMPALDAADAEVLALAKNLSGSVIVDETACRTTAKFEGIKCHGSVFLLFLLYKKGIISKVDVKSYLDKMLKIGWRCSPELYAAMIQKLEEL